jgi:hypothetical protein
MRQVQHVRACSIAIIRTPSPLCARFFSPCPSPDRIVSTREVGPRSLAGSSRSIDWSARETRAKDEMDMRMTDQSGHLRFDHTAARVPLARSAFGLRCSQCAAASLWELCVA